MLEQLSLEMVSSHLEIPVGVQQILYLLQR